MMIAMSNMMTTTAYTKIATVYLMTTTANMMTTTKLQRHASSYMMITCSVDEDEPQQIR